MTKVKLIGVNHYDGKPENLKKALEREKPDILTQELSSERDYERLARWLDKIVNERWVPPNVEKQLDFHGQELFRKLEALKFQQLLIPRLYKFQHGIPLHYIDHPDIERERFGPKSLGAEFEKSWIESLRGANYEQITVIFELMYDVVRLVQQNDLSLQTEFLNQCPEKVLANDRDLYPTMRIHELTQGFQGKLVHLCGAAHTLDDAKQRTLYSKLKTMGGVELTRATLKDYD